MLFSDIISKKRDGAALSAAEIGVFVDGLTDGSLPAEQVAAMAMAICWRSMTVEECGELTMRMAGSGTTLTWPDGTTPGPVVDKHSTGGVGDKLSLMLAPIAAACGCAVPMISGRGLGHTGGTLDKLEAIPGYDVAPTRERFEEIVQTIGCAIIGQTADLAPADRRLYAIRDITATIDSVPLITASILSKKIAAGDQGLVLDIKVGNGAFMRDMDRARELARSLISTAGRAGVGAHALITDMNAPLGHSAGNALEVSEAVAYLRGEERDARLHEITLALAAEMLLVGAIESDEQAARRRAQQALDSGRAAEIFGRMVAALGGPADFVERAAHYLPAATVVRPVHVAQAGYLQAVDTRALGNAIVELGGGRRRGDDVLDPAVGLDAIAAPGAWLDADVPLARVHATSEAAANEAALALLAACTVGTGAPPALAAVHETLRA